MRIGLLVYPDCLPAGLFGFSDLLMAANLRLGHQRFACHWLSERGGPLATANGLSLATEPLAERPVDGVLVPGAWRDTSTALSDKDEGVVDALTHLPLETRLWSYCTGVCLAARTGRLDSQPATTTWWLRGLVGHRFPAVNWKPHQTLVYREACATASGVNGYLPLALALLEEQCGESLVADIRRHMVLPRPEGRHTPLQDVPGLLHHGGWMRTLVQTIEGIPAGELDTARLAAAMNTSARTLQRRVLRESGYRCGELMRLVKLNQVGEQLITTDNPLAVIGHVLGFPDEASLRRSFRQVTGMTPGGYREHFARHPLW
ncbi:GlxA family transcriptional regulator [Marinobacter lacisalsi]|uniref:GlxA family transcriptional regulator n=1 Tax=Marinobacter lacisalsi TaxID=475979 RepID=A0ABV8QEP4_9GAMM